MNFLCPQIQRSLQLSNPTRRPHIYVTQEQALSACVQDLSAQQSIAFDLEFDSHRNAYGTTLCLIQFATVNSCYIIDPMRGLDLSGIFALFENPAQLKIVHAPGEDLRVLHGIGCKPQNLFDTDVAAKLLNYEQSALATMLFTKLGIVLDKGQQRSNWMRRPLTPEQIQYAADDVLYLHELKAALVSEAEEHGLLQLVFDEQTIWSTNSFAQEDKDFFLKGPDLYQLSPFDQHVLNELFRYRDELARALNKPAFQVMDETVVRAIADGSLLPENLPDTKGIYGGYKTERFAWQTEARLAAIRDDAARRELSKELPQRRRFTPEDRAAKSKADQDRASKFAPLQAALAARFGEFAGRFILSKGKTEEVLKGNLRIGEIRPPSRATLIQSTATEIGIDLSEYI